MASKRFALLTLPLAAASLTFAACGGDSGGSSAGDDRDRFREAALDYAQCMREHGVDVPDPKPGSGGLMLKAPEGGESKVRSAQEACSKHMENVRPPELSREQEAEFRERALEHARCMREHGIDMPDPQFSGGGRVQVRLPPGVKPGDPRLEEAQRACGGLGPKAPPE